VEFDLQRMLSGEHFADFALFYGLVHRSRLPLIAAQADECRLEKYHQREATRGCSRA
jgi:hypothetical protein